MSPLLLAVVATALAAVYLVVRRRVPAGAPALADTADISLDWLTAHELRPLAGGRSPVPPAGGWRATSVAGLSAAEDLLDALEAAGFEEMELVVREGTEFVVRRR
jgi:hypothetical protein